MVQSNLFPCAYARHFLHGRVFGTVIAGHGLAAAFVRGVRRTRAWEILLGGLHDTFGPLNPLMNPVPVLAQPRVCFFFSACTVSFSCRHPVRYRLYKLHYILFYFIATPKPQPHPQTPTPSPKNTKTFFPKTRNPVLGTSRAPLHPPKTPKPFFRKQETPFWGHAAPHPAPFAPICPIFSNMVSIYE